MRAWNAGEKIGTYLLAAAAVLIVPSLTIHWFFIGVLVATVLGLAFAVTGSVTVARAGGQLRLNVITESLTLQPWSELFGDASVQRDGSVVVVRGVDIANNSDFGVDLYMNLRVFYREERPVVTARGESVHRFESVEMRDDAFRREFHRLWDLRDKPPVALSQFQLGAIGMSPHSSALINLAFVGEDGASPVHSLDQVGSAELVVFDRTSHRERTFLLPLE